MPLRNPFPFALTLTAAGLAQAEDAAPERAWFGGAPIASWSQATGDWAGARTSLAKRGIHVDGSLVVEVSDVLRVGSADDTENPPRRLGQRSQLNLGTSIDLDALVGLPAAEIRARYQYAGGDDAANRVGDAQGWSNISVDADIHQLSELWYQQRFGAVPSTGEGDLLRLKLGKVDANSEFDTVPALGQFLNSSAGFSPTTFPMPTYPDPATSVNLFVQPLAGIVLGLGYYDAAATTRGARLGELGASTFFARGADRDKLWIA